MEVGILSVVIGVLAKINKINVTNKTKKICRAKNLQL